MRINDRIERGVRDGRITDREARRLYRQLHEVRAKERSYRRDNRRIGPRAGDPRLRIFPLISGLSRA